MLFIVENFMVFLKERASLFIDLTVIFFNIFTLNKFSIDLLVTIDLSCIADLSYIVYPLSSFVLTEPLCDRISESARENSKISEE